MAGSLDPKITAARVVTVLQAAMSAKLTALIAEYGDSIPLPVPDNYWKGPQTRYPGTCNLVIVPGLAVRRNLGGEKANGQTIFIGIVAAGNPTIETLTPTEVLSAQLWRYTRACVEILEANNKLTVDSTNNADEILVEDMDPEETAPLGPGAGFEQRLVITLIARTS